MCISLAGFTHYVGLFYWCRMGNHKSTLSLLARAYGSRNITVNNLLCRFMGSIEAGVFLSQLLYWSDKGDGDWFHKSYPEWEEEITMSRYLVNKYASLCESMGFLKRELRYAGGSPRTHYYMDMRAFEQQLSKFIEADDAHTHITDADDEADHHENFDGPPLTDLTVHHETVSRSTVKLFNGDRTPMTTPMTTPLGLQDLRAAPDFTQSPLLDVVAESAEAPPVPEPPPTAPVRMRTVVGADGTKEILAAYVEACGYKPASYGQEATYAKKCAAAGYTPADVVRAYQILKAQAFWSSKHLSLATVYKEIPALRQYAENGGNLAQVGKRMSNTDEKLAAAEAVRARLKAMGREDLL